MCIYAVDVETANIWAGKLSGYRNQGQVIKVLLFRSTLNNMTCYVDNLAMNPMDIYPRSKKY